MDNLKIYTDGTFFNNRYGGAFVVFNNDTFIYEDCGIGLTDPELLAMRNISGELSAVMHAALWLSKNNLIGTIVHDYTGVACWVTGEWKTKKKYTKIYKDFMLPYYLKGIVKFEWVKGHTKCMGNERADVLAAQSVISSRQWCSC
jgi:ribonuclease HI